MDGFSYTNIFATKGIEYLMIIAFMLIIIHFWIALNRKAGKKKDIRKNSHGIK
jgi:glycine cleavage system H protein